MRFELAVIALFLLPVGWESYVRCARQIRNWLDRRKAHNEEQHRINGGSE